MNSPLPAAGLPRSLYALSAAELKTWCLGHGFPAYRAKQLRDRLYADKPEADAAAINNLPADLKRALAAEFSPLSLKVKANTGEPGSVEKLALELADGEVIEMVIIPSRERLTFCLSTQVGCPVGCRFCASGRGGLKRNLRRWEILEEFYCGVKCAGRPDNLVFMGIGEGLANFDELAAALQMLTSPEGFRLSPRRLTVSTSGFIPGMKRFAALPGEYNLAVSLHAPDDRTRALLIPDALRYPIADILRAADEIARAHNRRYTLEYTLIAGINDAPAQGTALGKLAREHLAKINLIPYNQTGDPAYRRPGRRTVEAFAAAAESAGAQVTVRVERGSSETAACGQLRRQLRREE